MWPIINLKSFYEMQQKDADLSQPAIGHFNIFRLEDLSASPKKPLSYSRRDFFKISFVKGDGIVHYADRSVEAKGTVLAFTNPMIPFLWEKTGGTNTGFAVIFTEAFFYGYGSVNNYPVFQHAANGILTLDDTQANEFSTLLEKMYKEIQSDYEFKYDLLRNLLAELIHTAQKLQPTKGYIPGGPKANERMARLFMELLERQFPIETTQQEIRLRTATDFANALNVHINHLNKSLKNILGHSTLQLINDRIMQEARLLLKGTDWTIAEIALCLGFEEPNHFSSFFKSRSELSPSQYRQNVKD